MSKEQRSVTYVRSFAPWILYAALSSLDWRVGMCAAAVAAAALLLDSARKRDLDLLGEVTCAFFVVMAAVSLSDPRSAVQHWVCALAAGTLAAVALVSLAVRRPFTLALARRETPREYWTSPFFMHVNIVISAVWAAAFTCSATACAVVVSYAHANTTLLIAIQVLAFVAPLLFTKSYTERAKAHGAQLAVATAGGRTP
jgi:hypothetical protein